MIRASTFIFSLANTACASTVEFQELVEIHAGQFMFGSDQEERENAYTLDEQAYGHSITRTSGWYDNEPELQQVSLNTFHITKY